MSHCVFFDALLGLMPSRHMYHVLAHGHIIQFHLTSTKSAHHHRSKTINLRDAYIYSGQLAVASLPILDKDNGVPIPKRYQDGLEADDGEDDVTFIIRSAIGSKSRLI